MARKSSWHWERLPLLLLFPYYSAWCDSAVIYKFQSPAKSKLPFIVLAGVQALDVPALRGQLALPWEGCQCLSSLPIGSDPLALQLHLKLSISNRLECTQPLKFSSLLLLDFTRKATNSYFFPRGVFKLLLFPVYCYYSFLFVLL